MNIIILGAGAIGSFYGAKLATKHDVSLVARKEHAAAINSGGLQLKGKESARYPVSAVTKLTDIPKKALLILTTKVTDSERTIADIVPLLKKDTVILCLQNGLYSETIVKRVVGDRCTVLRGITTYGCIYQQPGVVEYQQEGTTIIEQNASARAIKEALEDGGLHAEVTDNIKKAMWQKVIINCALNPIAALLKITNGQTANELLNPVKDHIIRECMKVARADGVTFDGDMLKFINERLEGSKNQSSMLQDIKKGHRTEIMALNGAVVALGQKHKIACPVNESMVSLIRMQETLVVPKNKLL